MDFRKIQFVRETIYADGHYTAADPVHRVAALAVFRNPCAGRFVEDLTPLFDIGGAAGDRLAGEACRLLGAPAMSYGKAALVGVAGDMEHGGAAIHPKLGRPMREAVGGGAAIIPSNVKVGVPGTAIDVPLGHKDEVWSFDHFDTMTVAMPDGPRPEEILLVMAFATAGRPLPRCGQGPIRD